MSIHRRRLQKVRKTVDRLGLDALLVTTGANIRYLSGFRGHDAMLLVTRTDAFFVTDSRYIEEVEESVRGFTPVLIDTSAYTTLRSLINTHHLNRTGFEAANLPYAVAVAMKRRIRGTRLLPVKGIVEKARAVKDEGEIAAIRRAIRLTRTTLEHVLHAGIAGISEAALRDRIEAAFIHKGARPSFDPIVAFGRNTSKPHAVAGATKIGKNGALMVDLGCTVDGYASDMTRMVFLGRISKRLKDVYRTVKRAHEMALAMIRPGVRISDIDSAARGHIAKEGYGEHFGHALGHGVGLEVHEAPSISPGNHERLETGMVFTVEPAIYLPKECGVRIENMVLVTGRGCEILTRRQTLD